jgi:hypothetical protein
MPITGDADHVQVVNVVLAPIHYALTAGARPAGGADVGAIRYSTANPYPISGLLVALEQQPPFPPPHRYGIIAYYPKIPICCIDSVGNHGFVGDPEASFQEMFGSNRLAVQNRIVNGSPTSGEWWFENDREGEENKNQRLIVNPNDSGSAPATSDIQSLMLRTTMKMYMPGNALWHLASLVGQPPVVTAFFLGWLDIAANIGVVTRMVGCRSGYNGAIQALSTDQNTFIYAGVRVEDLGNASNTFYQIAAGQPQSPDVSAMMITQNWFGPGNLNFLKRIQKLSATAWQPMGSEVLRITRKPQNKLFAFALVQAETGSKTMENGDEDGQM